MVQIVWASQSIDDINSIAEYIAKDSAKYAELQVFEFFEAVKCLKDFPKTGRIVPEVNDKNLREIIVGFYRIIYLIKTRNQIVILTVYHSMRLLTRKKIKQFRKG